jgi:hypothetical protein
VFALFLQTLPDLLVLALEPTHFCRQPVDLATQPGGIG